MKEDIQKWKDCNGNNTFTQKDLTIFLITKVEKIDDRIDDLVPRLSKMEGYFSAFKLFVGTAVAVMGWLVFQHI